MEKKNKEILSLPELKEQFKNPSIEYAPVDCWWWEAGQLNEEKMSWQLEEMRDKGIGGTWYYPRYLRDEPLSCKPRYWTEKWWDFNRHSLKEHKRLGLRSWFSDWTYYGFFQDIVRAEKENNPVLGGNRLIIREMGEQDNGIMEIPVNEKVLEASEYKMTETGLDYSTKIDLTDVLIDNKLSKSVKTGWKTIIVTSQPHDLDYMNKTVTERWIEVGLKVYDEKLAEYAGNTLKAYGMDEILVLSGNILYSQALSNRFLAEKGYDLTQWLSGIFYDIGQMTDKIRCDYFDIMITLLEENFHKPIQDWLHKRGMKLIDFCPYGKNENILHQTYHYGDHYRRMRNLDIGGAEADGRQRSLTFYAKTAGSIAQLYGQKRVGICSSWGTGWEFSLEQNMEWTNDYYAHGINFYNNHCAWNNTMSGWGGWVPPAIHFYQPYWQYWKHFTNYIRRLSYILSQGVQQCDAALLYPVTTVHANWSGGFKFTAAADNSVSITTNIAKTLFHSGIDLALMDDDSFCRAQVSDGLLKVSGYEFRVVVFPPLTTIRLDTLKKIRDFYLSGGTVVSFQDLPNASPSNGRDDPEIKTLLNSIFNTAGKEDCQGKSIIIKENIDTIPGIISTAIDRDIIISEPGIIHTHRKMGNVHVYFLYNTLAENRIISADLRVSGEPQIWDAHTGEIKTLHRFENGDGKVKVNISMDPYQGILLVFIPAAGAPEVLKDNMYEVTIVEPENNKIRIEGFCKNGGSKNISIKYNNRQFTANVNAIDPPEAIHLDELWNFKLEPTMNNRWGDFRYPPSGEIIGAEARRFRYLEESENGESEEGIEAGWFNKDLDDSDWEIVTSSYGPYWLTIGPFAYDRVPYHIEPDSNSGYTEKKYDIEEGSFSWERYSFSKDFGYEGKEGHTDDWGLQGVSENFIIFKGLEEDNNATRFLLSNVYSPDERDYYFEIGDRKKYKGLAWINRQWIFPDSEEDPVQVMKVHLKKGWNRIVVKLIHPEGKMIKTYAVFRDTYNASSPIPYLPRLRWFTKPDDLLFDIKPQIKKRIGWYRFDAPPGLKAMNLNLDSINVKAWVDGTSVQVSNNKIILESPVRETSIVTLCVEQKPGYYAGAAFSLPVSFECTQGDIQIGDWRNFGLETYSGGGIYSKIVTLDKKHLDCRILLELEQVGTVAEVFINDKPAGVLMTRPFSFDISDFVTEGDNKIRIKVANTLANHMSTFPTKYIFRKPVSGITAPVKICFLSKMELTAEVLQD